MLRLLLPFADLTGELPESVSAEVYDGTGEPPADLTDIEFYVVPYSFDRDPLELMERMPKLALVQTLTAGYEHILAHLPPGVRLCNAGGVHDASTAELALTLILAALRGVPDFVQGQERHEWRHARHRSLADRRVLLVGYGGVGSAIDRRLAGFEVDVTRVARHARDGVHPASALPDLLPQAEVVVISVPLSAQTRHLVDAEFLARMPDGALLVNVSRGQVVDTAALLAELTSGRLRAALDVTDPEPPPPDHPLWSVPGLLLSPHVGGNTTAFRPRARRLVVEQVRRYVQGEPVRYEIKR